MREHRFFPARSAAWLLALVAAFAAATGATASSASGMSCGQAVIEDWLDDSFVDHSYSASCYSSALHELPEDLRLHSSAGSDLIAARARSATTRERRSLESAQPALAGAPADSSPYPSAEVTAIAGAALIAVGAATSLVQRRRIKRIRES